MGVLLENKETKRCCFHYWKKCRAVSRDGRVLVLSVRSGLPEITGISSLVIQAYPAPSDYQQGQELWLEQINKQPDNAHILWNAAHDVQTEDRQLCYDLLIRGRSWVGNVHMEKGGMNVIGFRKSEEWYTDLAIFAALSAAPKE